MRSSFRQTGDGSSPRMRGTPCNDGELVTGRRVIPAYAGNTRSAIPTASPKPVHPRVCGEHCQRLALVCHRRGSSPRMRGTPMPNDTTDLITRFIPAYAGNTPCSDFLPRSPAVHPRVCGEHLPEQFRRILDHGSSPRMRGTLVSEFKRRGETRFIPAYAGNTAVC